MSLTDEEYAKCFDILKQVSCEHAVTVRWFHNTLVPALSHKDRIKILSIGAGTGDFDEQIIATFSPNMPLEYHFIESNPHHSQELEHRFSERENNRKFVIHACKFPSEEIRSEKFDIIIMAHVLYYFEDRQQAIVDAMKQLSDDGVLLIVHQTGLGVNQIQKQFRVNHNYSCSIQDLANILDNLGSNYSRAMLPTSLEVTSIFKNETETSDLLMSFFIETNIKTLSSQQQSDLTNLIKSLSFERAGRFFLFHPVGILLVANNQSALAQINISQFGENLP